MSITSYTGWHVVVLSQNDTKQQQVFIKHKSYKWKGSNSSALGFRLNNKNDEISGKNVTYQKLQRLQ